MSVNPRSSIDLVGYRASIVYDTPGVTRDRIFDDAKIEDKQFRVVDTGGIEVNSEDPLLNQDATSDPASYRRGRPDSLRR